VIHQPIGVHDEFKQEDMSYCKKGYFSHEFGLQVVEKGHL